MARFGWGRLVRARLVSSGGYASARGPGCTRISSCTKSNAPEGLGLIDQQRHRRNRGILRDHNTVGNGEEKQ